MKVKETTAKEAFNRATAGYELLGKKLEPFSAVRQAAAATMGLRFGLVDDADIFAVTVEKLKGRKMEKHNLQFYNEMFTDVVFVTWLCNVPVSRVLRVLRKVEEAKAEAFTWADKQGMALTTEPYFTAAGVFFQMMQDIAVSTVVPKVERNSDEDEDGDELPNE